MRVRGRFQATRVAAVGAALLVGVVLVVPVHAGTRLNGPFPPSEFARVLDFRLSPDGAIAVYRASFFEDRGGAEAIELYSVPLDASGPAVRISGAMTPGQEVFGDYRISPDSTRVVYAANQDNAGVTELYSVPIRGPASAGHKVNPPLVSGGNVIAGFDAFRENFAISPDSRRIVYIADQDVDGLAELYSAPLVTAGPVTEISESPGEGIITFEFTPGGSVVYLVNATGLSHLRAVPMQGPASLSVTLTLPPSGGSGLGPYDVSPDGTTVAYAQTVDANSSPRLYSVGSGGPATDSIPLSPTLVGSSITDVQFTPDSARVVYETLTAARSLFSVPADGSAGPAKISPDGAEVGFWDISADSSRVVFADSSGSLQAVPTAGPSSAAVALTSGLVVAGELPPDDPRPSSRGMAITSDSTRVVFRGEGPDRTDLYVVPIDGSGPPLNLSKVPAFSGVIGGDLPSGFIVNDQTERVVYRAQLASGPIELFSVALDGSEPPFTLNGPLRLGVTGAFLGTEVFDVTPEGSDVVYLAVEETDLIELYKAAVANSQPFVADPIVAIEADEDAPDVVIDLDSVFQDDDGDALEFTVTANSNPGLVAATVGSPLRLDFQPDQNGRADIRVTASDGDNTVSDEFTVRVNPVDDAPVARDDGPIEVGRGRSVPAFDVVANDVDADGDVLFAQILDHPAHGAASSSGGTIAYAHDGTAGSTDSLTYRAFDGSLFSAPASVSFNIVPSAPTIGLVDPGQGLWVLINSADVGHPFFFGNPGDTPVMGDWDCDGIDTPGLFRTSDAFAYLSNANRSQVADIRFFFGDAADVPLAGDWDGDGCDTLSIYRPAEQRFYIINELGQDEGGLGSADYSFGFGNPGDKPVVGDWDGDGLDEVGLHRESTGFFYYRNTLDTGIASGEFYFGDPADRFVAGDWGTVDEIETPAVFRPSNTTFYFRWTNTPGAADSEFVWGEASWLPVSGVID